MSNYVTPFLIRIPLVAVVWTAACCRLPRSRMQPQPETIAFPAVRDDGAAASRQDLSPEAAFRADIDADASRASGLFHRYEFRDIRDTPPPAGYAPFYITHYGRHGSRYQTERKSFHVLETLQAAKESGILTPAGEDILDRLRPIAEEHEGMYGQLSLLGAEEHQRLARRMYARFPEVFDRSSVFASDPRVRCQSSTIQRCLTSMANFSIALKDEAPQLDFEFSTGDRYMATILHPYAPSEERKKWLASFDRDIVLANVDPARLVALCFADDPKTREIVPEPHRFAFELFMAANSFQSLVYELGGTSIDDIFTRDELVGLARARSCIHFAHMGNAAEYGYCAVGAAHDLALDIARRAEEAMTSGEKICADLRFGHDSGLLPLVGLIGIEGAGTCAPAAESWITCPTWRGMPMAANLQIILYRKKGAETLAKVLYNEEETALANLEPVAQGPYYRWSDLKTRLETPMDSP